MEVKQYDGGKLVRDFYKRLARKVVVPGYTTDTFNKTIAGLNVGSSGKVRKRRKVTRRKK